MRETLLNLYDIEGLVFIKISDTIQKIKTSEQDYCLKYVKDDSLNATYAHVAMLSITYLNLPLLNVYGKYVSKVEDKYFILSRWYEDDYVYAPHLRMKFYLNHLADLHQRSRYSIRANDGFFSETYDFLLQRINDVYIKLDKELRRIEQSEYHSPSEWLLLLNNNLFYSSLARAKEHLELFKKETLHSSSVRLSLTYQNFAYSHILVQENIIISTQNLSFAPPLSDIESLFRLTNEEKIDLSGLKEDYFAYIKYENYELHWLQASILIPSFDSLVGNEIQRIIALTKMLDEIRVGEEVSHLISSLKISKQG